MQWVEFETHTSSHIDDYDDHYARYQHDHRKYWYVNYYNIYLRKDWLENHSRSHHIDDYDDHYAQCQHNYDRKHWLESHSGSHHDPIDDNDDHYA